MAGPGEAAPSSRPSLEAWRADRRASGGGRGSRQDLGAGRTHGKRNLPNEQKAAARAMWQLGDYHRFAKATVWELGPVLVEACGIGPGQRVLDVATGTGNVAIRAAEAGAEVVASDLTPENFDPGRREARELGVELEWVEADAEALPFGDGEFDVVTSSLGAIFAPDHRKVADELLRVCRPGGTIGMVNFTPEGLAADFFAPFARYAPPPPPDALPPLLWGSEEHVRELFGDRVESLELSAPGLRRASRDPARLRRALRGDLRAADRPPRVPRRRARARRGARRGCSSSPSGRTGRARRARRVPVRVSAGGRPQARLSPFTVGVRRPLHRVCGLL